MNAPLHHERPTPLLDAAQARARIDAQWDGDILRQLTDYIAIPAKSPVFDPDWAAHGFIDTVVRHAADWVQAQKVPGLTLEVVRLPGRTPVIFFEIPATRAGSTQTALLYGHLDKQPEFTGWRADLGPWTPKYEDGKLYGRGGADDGYAVYAAIAAVQALKAQGLPHPRIVGLIETSEESGSPDLLPYIDALRPRLGDVGLVVCLDSGAGNYDQFWLTTSLRGNITGTLKVEVLTEGVHSGDASGLVPSSFRILRQVLERLEDSASGRLLPPGLHCDTPAERVAQARATAAILGDDLFKRFPWVHYDCGGREQSVLPMTDDPVDALLEDNAPYQARVTFESLGAATGWNAPDSAPWFAQALHAASHAHFGAPCGYIGQGGTIPLMNQLSQGFPSAQMMVCGVLGPRSNAHGPNEFLHVPYAKRLTAAVAEVIARMP